MHIPKNNFSNTFFSYKESSWAEYCFWLLQIWFIYLLNDQQMRPSKAVSESFFYCLFSCYTYNVKNNKKDFLQLSPSPLQSSIRPPTDSTCPLHDSEVQKSGLQIPAKWKTFTCSTALTEITSSKNHFYLRIGSWNTFLYTSILYTQICR